MEYLTPQMVSETLHLSLSKVYKLFKMPDFPSIKIGRQLLVSGESLKKYLSTYEGGFIDLP